MTRLSSTKEDIVRDLLFPPGTDHSVPKSPGPDVLEATVARFPMAAAIDDGRVVWT